MKKDNMINDVPQEFFAMLSQNFYDAEEQKEHNVFCSVSEIVGNPPKLFWLKKRHSHELVTKASGELWKMFGSVMHLMLENALKDNARYIIEKRMYADFSIKTTEGNNVVLTISGKFDVYDTKTKSLKDLKTTSVYKVNDLKKGEVEQYESQLNVYKYMFDEQVDSLSVLYFAKDWDKRKAFLDEYISTAVGEIGVPMWNDEATEKYIALKVSNFYKYKDTPDDEIPPCPVHERWHDPIKPTLALYSGLCLTKKNTIKKGSRAKKLFQTIDELIYFVITKGIDLFGIEFRPIGKPKRCYNYCDYNIYCNYFTSLHKHDLFNKTSAQVVLNVEGMPNKQQKIKEMVSSSFMMLLDDEDKKNIGI